MDNSVSPWRWRAPALVLALMAWLLALPVHARPVVPRPSPEAVAQLRARIRSVLTREKVPGAGIALVTTEGVVFSGGVGLADPASQRPVTADTPFRVGSITKSIVALGLVELAARGRVDLDAPVTTLVPDVAIDNRWEHDAPITVGHLLEHTAGFDDMRFNETFDAPRVEHRPLVELLAINPRSRVARWRPGTRMSYANPGYTVAAHIIERVTGRPYEAWLHDAILLPLGMQGVRMRHDPAIVAKLARGHRSPGVSVPYQGLVHRPAGSMIASARQLGQLVAMWLRRTEGPQVVGPPWLDRIERNQTLPYPATDSSYGLGNYGDTLHAARSRGHDGGLPGYLSSYRYFPELGVGYVMLLNGSHSALAYLEIRELLFRFLVEGRSLPPPPRAEVPPEQLAEWTGYYGHESPRHELLGFLERALGGLRVTQADDRVWLEPLALDVRIPLIPTGPARFRLPGRSGTDLQFARTEDGETALVTGFGYYERGSLWLARARLRGLQIVCWLLASAVLLELWWLLTWGPRVWLGARVRRAELRLLAPSVVAAAALAGALAAFVVGLGRGELGTPNVLSISVFVLTLLCSGSCAVASSHAVRALVRADEGVRPWVRGYALLVATSGSLLSLYLTVHHVIGLRTWAW